MATEDKNLSQYNKETIPNAQSMRFGIVTSNWNDKITCAMRDGAIKTLIDCGAYEENIISWDVPGSVELVNGAKRMLKQDVDAVIIIGCVIQGETRHFDFVCDTVTQGVAYLNATQDVPIIFCVLTDNNIQQSIERSGGKHGNKGVEAAITAIKMVNLGK